MSERETTAFIQKACTALSIKATSSDIRDTGMILQMKGFDSRLWDQAIEKSASDYKFSKLRPTIAKVLSIYENLCDKNHRTDCRYCDGTGYVDVILISGEHNSYHVDWIFDSHSVSTIRFLQHKFQSGKPMKPSRTILPCNCENGDKRNNRAGGEWLNSTNRARAVQRCFSKNVDDNSEFQIAQWIDFLNLISQGRDEEYEATTIEGEHDRLSAIEDINGALTCRMEANEAATV